MWSKSIVLMKYQRLFFSIEPTATNCNNLWFLESDQNCWPHWSSLQDEEVMNRIGRLQLQINSCLTDRNTIINQMRDLQPGSICPRYSLLLYHSYIEHDAVLGFLTSGFSVTESEIGPEPRAACISSHALSAVSHYVLLPLLEASPGPSEL